jgi:molybdenum cofactor cytidylyltransferase
MTGIIVLAAGASTRLGEPKQQLVYKGKTLLQHALDTAVESMAEVVVLVLGANAELIKNGITNKEVAIVYNNNWQEGMASSIHAGITELQKLRPNVDDVILMLCDQPYVSSSLLDYLIFQKQSTSTPIVACSYNNTIGPPALFDNTYFPELLALKGQEGAKKLLMKYHQHVFAIPFDEGAIDIDTLDDYKKFV